MPTIIQVVAATGQNVYVFIYDSSGNIWDTVSLAFVTYNVANWTRYAIVATEQTGSGSYLAIIPTQITTPGSYSWIGYIRLGGSPASGDTPVSQGPFVIPPASSTFVVPSTLSGLILTLRSLASDAPDSKVIDSEQLGLADMPQYPVDGSNQTFQLKSRPLSDLIGMPSYSWATIVGTGAAARSQSLFTIVDPINGIIHFNSAPNPGSATAAAGVYMAYNYEWFTDAKYAQFIYQAAQMTLAGTTDPTTIVNGLVDAMLQYGLSLFYTAMASTWAQKYAATAGDSSEQGQVPAQTYRMLAKDAKANGDNLRTAFYQRQGQREAPASATISLGWDPISPRR